MKARLITLLLLWSALSPAQASGLEYPNRYRGIAETIFDMMDAFTSAYNKRRGVMAEPPLPAPGGIAAAPLAPYPGQPGSAPWPATPSYSPAALIGRRLTGYWQGATGEILVIHNGRFRIYLDRDNFRDGRVLLHNERFLSLFDPVTNRMQRYEYAEHQGRLVLRDAGGTPYLYRRLRF